MVSSGVPPGTPQGRRQSIRKVGFFELPLEIRDKIYNCAVADISRGMGHKGCRGCDYPYCRGPNIHGSQCSDCQGRRAFNVSARPLRLVDEPSCHVPDMWLKSVSLVSRRFAAEIRSVFFQVWCFTVFHRQKDSQSQPKNATALPNTFAFLDALGADSKNLRRLEIYCSSDYEPVARASERAFKGVTRLLHPDILVTLNVSVNEWDFRDGSALIGCRFDEHGRFNATRLNTRGLDAWGLKHSEDRGMVMYYA